MQHEITEETFSGNHSLYLLIPLNFQRSSNQGPSKAQREVSRVYQTHSQNVDENGKSQRSGLFLNLSLAVKGYHSEKNSIKYFF